MESFIYFKLIRLKSQNNIRVFIVWGKWKFQIVSARERERRSKISSLSNRHKSLIEWTDTFLLKHLNRLVNIWKKNKRNLLRRRNITSLISVSATGGLIFLYYPERKSTVMVKDKINIESSKWWMRMRLWVYQSLNIPGYLVLKTILSTSL